MKRHALFRRHNAINSSRTCILSLLVLIQQRTAHSFSPAITPTKTLSPFGFIFLNRPHHALNQSFLYPNTISPPIKSHHAVSKISPLGMSRDSTSTDRIFAKGLVTISSTLSLILIDFVFRRLLKSLRISYPSSLAGCGALLTTLLAASAIKEEWGDYLYGMLAPGAGLLAKWLPVCLVPNLVVLPLAENLGSHVEVSLFLLPTLTVLGFILIHGAKHKHADTFSPIIKLNCALPFFMDDHRCSRSLA